MDDFEKIFDDEIKKDYVLTSTDKIIKSAELEFQMGGTEKQLTIKNESEDLLSRKKKLEKELSKCKNVRNIKMTQVNKKMAERRTKIRNQINIINLKLDELKIEVKHDN